MKLDSEVSFMTPAYFGVHLGGGVAGKGCEHFVVSYELNRMEQDILI